MSTLTLFLTTVTIETICSMMIIMLVYFFCTLFLFASSIKYIAGGRTYYKICIVSIATIVR